MYILNKKDKTIYDECTQGGGFIFNYNTIKDVGSHYILYDIEGNYIGFIYKNSIK